MATPSNLSTLSLEDAFGTCTPFSDEIETSDIFAESWERALKHCRQGLNPDDYELVLRFGSAEKLADDLKFKEDNARQSWLLGVRPEVLPIVDILRNVSKFFMICMKPSNVSLTMLWGFLHLTIELSIESERRWTQMVGILKQTRRALSTCKVSAEIFDKNEEMKTALLDVFIALIRFWSEASKFMREKNSEKITSTYLDTRFKSTLQEMEDSLKTLQTCASIRATGIGDYRSTQQDQGIAELLNAQHLIPSHTQYSTKQRYQLPYNNEDNFIGRRNVLAAVESALNPVVEMKHRYFTIWGIGGIGKSQIALAYANDSLKLYGAIFWVRAETDTSLRQSFADIASNLQIPGWSRTSSHDDTRDLVHSWLMQHDEEWLMIFPPGGEGTIS